ncbi:ATPase [Marinilongibacter aquaticus]|uniref:TrkH family potassium uptake protein n=1 Tax=Marinilongibacter aquaticus TaxID=2975157 RepID=UPI0021BDD501|nr:potassium transporter TrkG [Marinilongibacter aquaticus]UBM58366.1 ATPase [Marinilongibacter aquaticus]
MKFRDHYVDILDRLTLVREKMVRRLNWGIFTTLLIGFALVIYQIGFPKEQSVHDTVVFILEEIPWVLFLLYIAKWFFQSFVRKKPKVFDRNNFSDFILALLLFAFETFRADYRFLSSIWFLYILLSVMFVIRVMRESSNLKSKRLTPSILFVVSFVMLIFVGTALLLIPDASTHRLSVVDALFTATSAVCVTGLTVVDTSTAFTPIGQDLLLVLIQIGGLGLMTFTNFFAILFQGGISFRNHLILSDIMQTDKPNSLFSTLMKILAYTVVIEILGVFFIHYVTNEEFFTTSVDSWMFSTFHAISAFCNAGFSTLPNGLYNVDFRYNYDFQMVICFLVILGGIGFPVVIDLYNTLKSSLKNLLRSIFFGENFNFQARNLNVHSRLVLTSTLVLLTLGTVLFFITEYQNTLLDHPTLYGKFVQAFFGSVTPRTAGFNTVDMGALMQGTILIYLLLMWIGASPSSTGGGIKTTTFTIAISNIVSLARGKDRVDLFRREVSDISIKRAFAVLFLSLLIIGLAVLLISIFEPNQELTAIAFECFSAYSTVGLSLNLTPELGTASKLILVVTMFLGRVGMFTLLFGLFKKAECRHFHYPRENVLIV